jgi:mono/diheme cytochrome c family protein
VSSDKDKTKPEGTSEKAPLDSMAAGAEEPATSPTSIVAHPSEEHEQNPVEPVDLDAPSTLDDGQDSPMMGFATLVLVFVTVLTVAVARTTTKDGPLLLENRTQAIAVNGAYIPTVAVATIAAPQVAVAAMAVPGMPHVPDSNAPPPPPVAPVAAPPPGNTDIATASTGSSEPSWQAGEALFKNPVNACATCHSTDGSRLVGPTLKDKYGTTEKLADGSTVTVDDAYIKESLLNPMAKVVEGYAPAMPSQDGKFSDADIQSVILYIRHLAGKDPTP